MRNSDYVTWPQFLFNMELKWEPKEHSVGIAEATKVWIHVLRLTGCTCFE